LTKDGAKLCKACNGYVGVVKFILKWHDGAKNREQFYHGFSKSLEELTALILLELLPDLLFTFS